MQKNYFIQLDGLRFLAVAGVAFAHWTINHHELHLILVDTFIGLFSITLFFVLSGFLITQILINRKNSGTDRKYVLKQFYIRRFLRIFPLYYAVLAAAYLLNIPAARPNIAWFLTYTANINEGMHLFNAVYLVHLWSLSVEEQFYIVFPFIILFIPGRYLLNIFKAMIIIGVVSRFVSLVFFPYTLTYSTFTTCCFDSFGFGAILAWLTVYKPDKLLRILKRRILFITAIVLLAANFALIFFRGENLIYFITGRLFCSIVAFFIIGNAAAGNYKGLIGKFLENKTVIYLGKISYGLYVFHYIVPWIFSHEYFTGTYIELTYPFVTVALAAISWHYFEKPINGLKDKFPYGNPAVSPEAAGRQKDSMPVRRQKAATAA